MAIDKDAESDAIGWRQTHSRFKGAKTRHYRKPQDLRTYPQIPRKETGCCGWAREMQYKGWVKRTG